MNHFRSTIRDKILFPTKYSSTSERNNYWIFRQIISLTENTFNAGSSWRRRKKSFSSISQEWKTKSVSIFLNGWYVSSGIMSIRCLIFGFYITPLLTLFFPVFSCHSCALVSKSARNTFSRVWITDDVIFACFSFQTTKSFVTNARLVATHSSQQLME